jgi:hypothetical protein
MTMVGKLSLSIRGPRSSTAAIQTQREDCFRGQGDGRQWSSSAQGRGAQGWRPAGFIGVVIETVGMGSPIEAGLSRSYPQSTRAHTIVEEPHATDALPSIHAHHSAKACGLDSGHDIPTPDLRLRTASTFTRDADSCLFTTSNHSCPVCMYLLTMSEHC